MQLNEQYRTLSQSYLFSTIAREVDAFRAANPQADLIRMGIGDVTLPLPAVVVDAFAAAVREQGEAAHFHGYGPEQGYDFLREAIRAHYAGFGVDLPADDIFVSDGAKSDIGNILDLFAPGGNTVLIPDPVYPVYCDTNHMAGNRVVFLDANRENGFLPLPDEGQDADLIYLCSPNNPTGAVYSRDQLALWVAYARKRGAILLFDAAYEAFLQDDTLPHSIFEIPGARECAIEFCSFSKTAGFTGTRCGYTVVPHELERDGLRLREMWLRRQTTKFNGVSYPVQRAAAAVFSPEGMAACRENIAVYHGNATVICDALRSCGVWHVGGENSPYVWMKCPGEGSSWDFFRLLLSRAAVVGTPGSGFGKNGEGYFRLTAFGDPEATRRAMARMVDLIGKI